jgi:hypothetical protein
MLSASEIAQRSSATVTNPAPFHLTNLQSIAGRWFLFSDYGVAARRHMAVVWSCILSCGLADAIWFPHSRLSFAPSNWPPLVQGAAYFALVGFFIVVALNRLRSDGGRAAAMLRTALAATELLFRTTLPIGALLTADGTLSYVITAVDLPLKDSLLARLDQSLGFDWLHFLDLTNSSPLVAALLARVYQTTGWVTELVILWLGPRLSGLIFLDKAHGVDSSVFQAFGDVLGHGEGSSHATSE